MGRSGQQARSLLRGQKFSTPVATVPAATSSGTPWGLGTCLLCSWRQWIKTRIQAFPGVPLATAVVTTQHGQSRCCSRMSVVTGCSAGHCFKCVVVAELPRLSSDLLSKPFKDKQGQGHLGLRAAHQQPFTTHLALGDSDGVL